MSIVKAFNTHIIDFINDVLNVLDNNSDIYTAKRGLESIIKVNPKLPIKTWKSYITEKYSNEINNNNYDFFMDKDYSSDLAQQQNNEILKVIDNIRHPLKKMDVSNKEKIIKYVKNLTELSKML